jgi:hypothetical protein
MNACVYHISVGESLVGSRLTYNLVLVKEKEGIKPFPYDV